MAPRSWAQIAATGIKPSPLRRQITPSLTPRARTPSPAVTPLTTADFPKLSGDKGGSGEEKPSQDLAASRPESPCPTFLCPASPTRAISEIEEDDVPSSPKENTPNSSSATTTTTITTITTGAATIADPEEMGNAKRERKQAAKKAAEEAAKKARLLSSAPAPTAPASPPMVDKNKQEKDEKGKGVAPPSDDETNDVTTESEGNVEKAAEIESKEEALRQAMLASLERDRRVSLFGKFGNHDTTLILHKGDTTDSILVHRDILMSDAKLLASHLPPPDENGHTTYKMVGYDLHMVGPLVTFMYMGGKHSPNALLVEILFLRYFADVPGHQMNRSNMWHSVYILYNVMFYRPAVHLGIKSMMDWQLNNIEEATNFFRNAFSGRFYYYQFTDWKKMAGLEIPLRMAHIQLYTEIAFPEEMRKMKLALAKLTLVVLPLLRRQISFVTHVQSCWEALPFPWREDMKQFHHDGLLPEFVDCFDENLNWKDDKDNDAQFDDQQLGVPGPSSAAPQYYAASIDEMTCRLAEAGFQT
ncbi:hypothetical protein EsH8_I_001309 [Colletotrichum jinshuiense]